MRNCVVVALLSILLAACNDNRAYYHFEHIDANGWEHNDTITFAIPPMPEGQYDMVLCMRATPTYPYKTLTIAMESSIVPGKRSATTNLRCYIYNNVGKLNGKKGISNTELRFPLSKLNLRKGDSLTVKIHHQMSRELLPGITDLGMELIGESDYDQHRYEGR